MITSQIGAALTVVVGLGCLAAAFLKSRQLERSRSWPAAQGTITHSGIRKDSEGYWFPDVSYFYEVNGVRIEGKGVRLGGEFGVNWSKSPAQKIADRFPIHSTPLVYYDPADPSSSCLVRSGPAVLALALIGSIFIGAGMTWWGLGA